MRSTTSIKDAIKQGDFDAVNDILTSNEKAINRTFYCKDTDTLIAPLDLAVKEGLVSIVNLLKNKGATISKKIFQKYVRTEEMKQACKNIKFSLHGSPPQIEKYGRFSSLNSIFEAIDASKDGKIVQQYIDYDPNCINAKDINRTSALESAVGDGHPESVRILLENGAEGKPKIFGFAAYCGNKPEKNINKLKILAQHGYGNDTSICTRALIKLAETIELEKQKNYLSVFEYILNHHTIDWNYQEERKNLVEIILGTSFRALKALLQFGRSKATDKLFADGKTLMQRIASGEIKDAQNELLYLLFKLNANPILRHYDSKATAYQIARLSKKHDIAEKIKTYTSTQYQGEIDGLDTIAVQDEQVQKAIARTAPRFPVADSGGCTVISYADLKLGEELGEGGFGKVYEATWNHGKVAVKILKDAYSYETIQDLMQEAALFQTLRAPNIVSMYGVVNQPGIYAIVMEHLEGGSLRNFLDNSELGIDWQLHGYKIAKGVLCGLAYLHNSKIIHSDLKSHNILLDAAYTSKLCDFGLAKIKSNNSSQSSTVHLSGTLGWMAPELFNDQKTSQHSDIYSLGILLWEMASRDIPWKGMGIFSIMQNVSSGNRPIIPKATPLVISNIIKQCLFSNPLERPSVLAIIEELDLQKKLSILV